MQCIAGGGGSGESLQSLPPPTTGPPKPVSSANLRAPRSMVAAFDYNPQESSPNIDVEVRTSRQPSQGGWWRQGLPGPDTCLSVSS